MAMPTGEDRAGRSENFFDDEVATPRPGVEHVLPPVPRRDRRGPVARSLSGPSISLLVASSTIWAFNLHGNEGPSCAGEFGCLFGQEGFSGDAVSAHQTSTAQLPTTTGIVAEVNSPATKLFNRALGDNPKSWYFELDGEDSNDGNEREALMLGGWWALADWCISHKESRTGGCYDLAAGFMGSWFGRDPRTVNTETWSGAGAIAGAVTHAYEVTERYLGRPARNHLVPELFGGRPGFDVLCEPTCVARLGA